MEMANDNKLQGPVVGIVQIQLGQPEHVWTEPNMAATLLYSRLKASS